MTEPKTEAEEIGRLYPWLLHWTINDERIGVFRSDAFAVQTADGTILIDPLPLTGTAQGELENVCAIFLTHGNHQRSSWRYRRELGAPVYVPTGVSGLDEEPDHYYGEGDQLPGGLQAIGATCFEGAACYLLFTHSDGQTALFCGDLICQDVGGPYRFPVEPSYFTRRPGEADSRRLIETGAKIFCTAHAVPSIDGANEALEGAIKRPDDKY